MDKLNMHTANKVNENFAKLAQLFPNAVTESIVEGEVVRSIDKDVLMQEISANVVEGKAERYQFTWPDKKKSVLLANAPSYKTLRPVIEDETIPTGSDSMGNPYSSSGSVDFDTTENLYIEGDNLDVLKLLQETYLGKIKMIYIDPPYNTGKDFVYSDKFKQSVDEYMDISGELDEEGNRLFTNSETNGRYHTDWLNMMYPRLRLAKDLLKDDGVIFISIDDNEVENLKKICDEVFGAWNFVDYFMWTKTSTPPSLSSKSRKVVEFVICYEKSKSNYRYFGSNLDNGDAPLLNTGNPIKKLTFPANSIKFTFLEDGEFSKGIYDRVELLKDIKIENGRNVNQAELKSEFKWGQSMVDSEIAKGTYFIVKSEKFSVRFQRNYDSEKYKTPTNLLDIDINKKCSVGTNESAIKELEMMKLNAFFDFPKPTSLISYLIKAIVKNEKESIILDFFSGSATTAHAVMQLNAEDGGERKFICVQLPELIEEKQEAYKAGYRNICEIGKERIRRAGVKIKEENRAKEGIEKLDTGFRVLKVDTSNMKDIYYEPNQVTQSLLDMYISNVKEGRTQEDLLFQVMLDLGILLSNKIETEIIEGKKIFTVYQGDIIYLIACFENDINTEVVTAIAKRKPYYAVFKDQSMENDSLMNSFEQIFKAYSKDTIRKVI